MFSTRPLGVVQKVGVVLTKVPQIVPCQGSKHNNMRQKSRLHRQRRLYTMTPCVRPTCVDAALVAVGSAQTEAAVAGVARLREGRRGVDGVPSTAQHVGGIQELGVGHRLQTQVLTKRLERGSYSDA